MSYFYKFIAKKRCDVILHTCTKSTTNTFRLDTCPVAGTTDMENPAEKMVVLDAGEIGC